MNNMLLRALTGSVYVLIIIGAILLGPLYFTVLMFIFAVLAIRELHQLCDGYGHLSPLAKCCDYALALLCLVPGTLDYVDLGLVMPTVGLIVLAVYVPLRIIAAVLDHADTSLRAMLVSSLSAVYIVFPLTMFTFISSVTVADLSVKSFRILALGIFVLLWINDTGAYLSGRTFGRTKLCERLSPKKTWEGFWGGFVLCAVVGAMAGVFLLPSMGEIQTIHAAVICGLCGMVISVVGTFGDLFESLLKRRIGVKDSGTLIPGHGGILDRIDSLLAAAAISPLILALLYFAIK